MIRIQTLSGGRARIATLPTWALGLVGVAAVAVGLIVLMLGAGLALILAPVALGAGLLARWRLKKALREAGIDLGKRPGERSPQPDVIDAPYQVIGDDPRR